MHLLTFDQNNFAYLNFARERYGTARGRDGGFFQASTFDFAGDSAQLNKFYFQVILDFYSPLNFVL